MRAVALEMQTIKDELAAIRRWNRAIEKRVAASEAKLSRLETEKRLREAGGRTQDADDRGTQTSSP